MKIEFKNLSNNPDPIYAHEGDSGFDLRCWIENSNESIILKPLERQLIHTGLYFKLPYNVEMQVRPRSGMAIKYGLSVVNSPGSIDSNYCGEICIIAINLSNENIIINNGDRIAQGIISPVYNSYFIELSNNNDVILESKRGSNGFGSTGNK
jgi:dUTP pyrophosphatase